MARKVVTSKQVRKIKGNRNKWYESLKELVKETGGTVLTEENFSLAVT